MRHSPATHARGKRESEGQLALTSSRLRALRPDRVIEQGLATHGNEAYVQVVGRHVHSSPTRLLPVLGVAGFVAAEGPDRAGIADGGVVNALHDHIGKYVIVAVKEDLDAMFEHQLVH